MEFSHASLLHTNLSGWRAKHRGSDHGFKRGRHYFAHLTPSWAISPKILTQTSEWVERIRQSNWLIWKYPYFFLIIYEGCKLFQKKKYKVKTLRTLPKQSLLRIWYMATEINIRVHINLNEILSIQCSVRFFLNWMSDFHASLPYFIEWKTLVIVRLCTSKNRKTLQVIISRLCRLSNTS